MRRFWTCQIAFLCFVLALNGQDHSWWNNLVQWDGKTPWQEYLELSTSGLGPNALPVPTFNALGIKKGYSFQNQFRFHYLAGDPTFDLQTRFDFAFSDRMAVAMWMVPVEYYNTSDELRDSRKIRQFEAEGFTSGDFYFGTYFHLLMEETNTIDIIISANLKTASGNNLEGGRVTDTPGYYFDATFAKNYGKCRPYLAGGLYVYQTFDGLHFQNDAFLYGMGLHTDWGLLRSHIEWAGYYGYLEIGDRPSVLRVNLSYELSDLIHLSGSLQYGLNDFDYTTIGIGVNYSKI